jgi:hypothetical protein
LQQKLEKGRVGVGAQSAPIAEIPKSPASRGIEKAKPYHG